MTPDAIRAARLRLGMSGAEFAAALGVEPQTVRRWEMDASRSSYRAPSSLAIKAIETLLATQKRQRNRP